MQNFEKLNDDDIDNSIDCSCYINMCAHNKNILKVQMFIVLRQITLWFHRIVLKLLDSQVLKYFKGNGILIREVEALAVNKKQRFKDREAKKEK